MDMTIRLSEELLRALTAGRRLKGCIFLERRDNEVVVCFYEYRQNSGKRRPPQTLLTLPHGTVRKTAKRYRLILSLPDALGERRIGDLMACETAEARGFMHALQEVLNVA